MSGADAGAVPWVTVVVPVYDALPYLERCASSIVDQTLPAPRYEAVFVDDGSTDGSGAYLDRLAASHAQVRVLHQANSGWPGQPRNAGLAAARGEYVFFCDADDWLAPDALADLCAFADAHGSEIVLPKMAGVGRPVPHHVFRRSVGLTSLDDGPLMESLTAHKLFRRSFLLEHDLRFPEEPRRLEDHHFMVQAYLLARTVGIYAEHTCYTHIRRDDAGNLTSATTDWAAYFRDLGETVELVERSTEPGRRRDRIFRRWLQTEMVARVSGTRFLALDPNEAHRLVAAAHEVAAGHFSTDVVELLPPVLRPAARALLAGDEDALRRRAEAVAGWSTRVEVLDLRFDGAVLRLSGYAQLHEVEARTVRGASPEARFLDLLRAEGAGPAAPGLGRPSVSVTLTHRTSGEQWPVPATVHGTGLLVALTADADLQTLAAGRPLPAGPWDLHVHARLLGLGTRARAHLVGERRPGAPTGPRSSPSARVVLQRRAISVVVGDGVTATWRARVRPGLRWRWRRLRRALRRRAGR